MQMHYCSRLQSYPPPQFDWDQAPSPYSAYTSQHAEKQPLATSSSLEISPAFRSSELGTLDPAIATENR